MNKFYGFLTFESAHKCILEPTAQWTGAVECKSCHNVIFTACMDFKQRGAHARTFNLKTANGCTCFNSPRRFRIVSWCGIQHSEGSFEMVGLTLLDEFSDITHDS